MQCTFFDSHEINNKFTITKYPRHTATFNAEEARNIDIVYIFTIHGSKFLKAKCTVEKNL